MAVESLNFLTLWFHEPHPSSLPILPCILPNIEPTNSHWPCPKGIGNPNLMHGRTLYSTLMAQAFYLCLHILCCLLAWHVMPALHVVSLIIILVSHWSPDVWVTDLNHNPGPNTLRLTRTLIQLTLFLTLLLPKPLLLKWIVTQTSAHCQVCTFHQL